MTNSMDMMDDLCKKRTKIVPSPHKAVSTSVRQQLLYRASVHQMRIGRLTLVVNLPVGLVVALPCFKRQKKTY